MQLIISESPSGKQRIIIDPSTRTVSFCNCLPAAATSFFSIPRNHPEFICKFEDIRDVHVDWWRPNSRWPKRIQIVTAHGSVWYRETWTNFDETWNVLKGISESTPQTPALRNVNLFRPLLIGTLIVAASIVVWVYFWLTGS